MASWSLHIETDACMTPGCCETWLVLSAECALKVYACVTDIVLAACAAECKPSASPARHGTYRPVIKADASAAHALLPGEVQYTAQNDTAGALRSAA